MSRTITKAILFNPLKTKIEVNFIEKFSPLRTEGKKTASPLRRSVKVLQGNK
jgi:hypothetical protein